MTVNRTEVRRQAAQTKKKLRKRVLYHKTVSSNTSLSPLDLDCWRMVNTCDELFLQSDENCHKSRSTVLYFLRKVHWVFYCIWCLIDTLCPNKVVKIVCKTKEKRLRSAKSSFQIKCVPRTQLSPFLTFFNDDVTTDWVIKKINTFVSLNPCYLD